MNITLRCRGSKREQARPPICAAGRQAHRRAGCRGDQCNAASNARVRPNRQHSYRCRGSCRPLPRRRRTTSSRHQRYFLSVVGELGFHYIAVERALLVEQWATRSSGSRAPNGRRRGSIAVRARSPAFCVLLDIGRPSSLEVQHRGSAPHDQRIWCRSRAQAIEPPRSRPSHRHFDSSPGSIPVATLKTGTAWCQPCCRGSLLFFAS